MEFVQEFVDHIKEEQKKERELKKTKRHEKKKLEQQLHSYEKTFNEKGEEEVEWIIKKPKLLHTYEISWVSKT